MQNHEELVSTLSKALCRIADALPRYERTEKLFQTPEIRAGTISLYTNLMKFLIRAMKWYEQGAFKRALYAFTKPVAIQYQDILDDIDECSRRLDQHAAFSAYAEQRDMHLEQRDMHREQQLMRTENQESQFLLGELMKAFLSLQPQLAKLQDGQNQLSTAVWDTNDRVYDVQLSSMLSFTAGVPGLDPQQWLRISLVRRNRRRLRAAQPHAPFLDSIRLRAWTTSSKSALLVVKGSVAVRDTARDFCVNAIEYLQSASIPVLWVLKDPKIGSRKSLSAIEMLKSLVFQALQLNTSLHTEKACALNCATMQKARTELDWINILAASLAGMPQTYVVVDMEAQQPDDTHTSYPFSWPLSFHALFDTLANRGCAAIVKVVLISYSAERRTLTWPPTVQEEDETVPISTLVKPRGVQRRRQLHLAPRRCR